MVKNKLKYILLFIPFIFTIGFSSWIIVYSFTMNPNYVQNSISGFFDYSYEKVFDATNHCPTPSGSSNTDGITFTYYYKEFNADDSNFVLLDTTNKGPVNAGTYEFKIEATGAITGVCRVKYTILPLKIKAKIIETDYSEVLSYNNQDCRKWTNFYNEFLNDKISFTDENNKPLSSSLIPSFKITEMSTGDDNCFYNTKSSNDIVIGSTYIVKFDLTTTIAQNYLIFDYEKYYTSDNKNDNFYTTNGSTILIYKTVLLNNAYYTIEKALEKTGNIYLVGDNTNTIFTAFTSFSYYVDLENNYLNYSVLSKTTLWLPMDQDNNETNNSTGNRIYSCLYIPCNVTLTVDGTIKVCGSLEKGSHKVYNRAILFNNGIINLNGELKSYGYTKGSGKIYANSGSKIYDVVTFDNDTHSGGVTITMSLTKIFPMDVYSMHNISCEIIIDYRSIYYIMYDIEMSVVSLSDNLVIIGSGGLFELKNGYIIKNVEDTTGKFYNDKDNLMTNYSKTNQDKTQREVIEIYGEFFDNVISIEQSGFGITTGKDYAMPIGFMSISLKSDDKGNVGIGVIKSNSYKFYPGSKFIIDEGSSLTINSDINIIFYDETFKYVPESVSGFGNTISYYKNHLDWYEQTTEPIGAQLIIKGTLTSLGSLGGYIQVASKDAVLQLSEVSAKLVRLTKDIYEGSSQYFQILAKTLRDEFTTDTINAQGCFNASTVSNLETGIYIGEYNSTEKYYYWTKADNAAKFVLEFYDFISGKYFGSKEVYVLEAIDGVYTYEITGNEYSYAKDYYVFKNWCLSNGDALSSNNNKLTTNKSISESDTFVSIKLYATWNPIVFSLDYNTVFVDSITSENIPIDASNGVLYPNTNITFTYEDILNGNINLGGNAVYNDCNFNGWYLNTTDGTIYLENTLKIDQFLLININDLNINNDECIGKITLIGRFTDYHEYTIEFDASIYGYNTPSKITNLNPNETISLPNFQTFNNEFEYQYYIKYWSFSPLKENNTQLSSNVTVNDLITLIDEYNANTTGTEIEIVNYTIKIYAHSDSKQHKIVYQSSLDSNATIYDTYYFNSGATIIMRSGLDADDNPLSKNPTEESIVNYEYKFDGWSLNETAENPEFIVGESYRLIDEDYVGENQVIKLVPHFAGTPYCTIKVTISNGEKGKATIQVSYVWKNVSYSKNENGTYNFDYGTNVTIKITFSADSHDKTHGTYIYSIIGLGSGDGYITDIQSVKVNADGSANTENKTYSSVKEHIEVSVTQSGGSSNCIPSGTLITLADGSIKKVEDLTLNDLLLVYNHETGKFEASPIVFIDDDGWKEYNIVNLVFSNGTITRLIYEHGYFDVTLNKYVYVDEYNYRDFIGHEFVYTNGEMLEYVTLVDSYVTTEYVGCYSPVTAVHLNYIVDGMLSMPGGIEGIFNIFEYGDNLVFDEELMMADIEKYGIMEYEVLAPYVPYEMYIAFNAKYFNVAIGKGYITFDEILYYAEKYLDRHGLRE